MNRGIIAAVVAAMAFALAGCIDSVDVSGGAVELSWTIRVPTETLATTTQTTCAANDEHGHGEIGTVRLVAMQLDCPDTGCVERLPDPFPCSAAHGVTPFEFPSGTWSLSIAVACAGGELVVPPAARVPDPIVREIRFGEVVQLNALLIVLDTANGQQVCAGA